MIFILNRLFKNLKTQILNNYIVEEEKEGKRTWCESLCIIILYII